MAADGDPVEVFTPTSGYFVAVLTWVGTGVALVAIVLTSPDLQGLRWALLLLVFALVVWMSQVRPRVVAYPDTLVIRHMLTDVHLPLAGVDTVTARHVLYVWVGEERHSCAGIGRSTRALARGGGPTTGPTDGAALDYVSYVESRIMGLAEAARRAQPGAPASTRRVWAVPEIGALTVLGTLFAVSLLLG